MRSGCGVGTHGRGARFLDTRQVSIPVSVLMQTRSVVVDTSVTVASRCFAATVGFQGPFQSHGFLILLIIFTRSPALKIVA